MNVERPQAVQIFTAPSPDCWGIHSKGYSLPHDPSDFGRDATSTGNHSDVLSRIILIHHYAVYCCDVQTYKEKPHRICAIQRRTLLIRSSPYHRFKLVQVLPRIPVFHAPFLKKPSAPCLFHPRSVVSTSIASVTNKLHSANHLSNGKET
jgi:hypothetical protein